MKKINLYHIGVLLLAAMSITGCYKRQTDFKYNASELDPHYNMTVKEFILSRGSAGTGSDTVFKWMQKAIEYAGVDLAEYEKPGRTYILLHTDAIRRLSSGKVNGGFFFDHPIIVKDASGNPIKSLATPGLDSTRPAVAWEEYSKATVKNLLLYLIINGEYGFDNLGITNTVVTTLLPPNTKADPKDSRLGWVVTKTTPNPDLTALTSITLNPATGTGFDPEGKMNLRIGNNDVSPIIMNDRIWDRTAGYYFTNGRAHAFSSTSSSAPRTGIDPFRYSWTE